MTDVDYGLRGKVAVIQFGNPPVNSLGYSLRAALVEALDRAAADTQVKAIVLYGKGGFFSAGADIREFNTPLALHLQAFARAS